MISHLFPSEARERLIRALIIAEFENPPARPAATLTRLAELVDLSPPVVLRHLEALARAGVVEKVPVPRSRANLYKAKPFFQATWIDPSRGIVTSWEATSAWDWRLPLVLRVPDERARRTLLKLLPIAHERGLLKSQNNKGKPDRQGRLPAITVHGSCARGDARDDSDLDLIVRTEQGANARKAWKDFIAEANLWAERPIDVRVMSFKELVHASPELHKSLTREGITIWAPFPSDEFLESFHLMALLGMLPQGGK